MEWKFSFHDMINVKKIDYALIHLVKDDFGMYKNFN